MHQWSPVSMRKLCVKAISLSWYIRTHHGRIRRMDFFTRAATSWETSLSAKRLLAVTSSTLVMGMAHWSRSPTMMGVERRRKLFPKVLPFHQVLLLAPWILSQGIQRHNQTTTCKDRYTLDRSYAAPRVRKSQ